MSVASPPPFQSIAIVGVGLIGGSIAAAIKQRGLAAKVVGIGRSRDRLEAAQKSGLVDVVAVDIAATGSSELIIICTPVDRIAVDVRAAAAASRCGATITDAGSVKCAICAALSDGLPQDVSFVGAHPLAGSEKTGWEHADPHLFEDRLCVLTPCSGTNTPSVRTVEQFWRAIGMKTRQMSPPEHDRVLALSSHLPHAVAAALAAMLSDDTRDFAATGFRDTTRIAAGDPNIWTGIFLQNAESVAKQIDVLIENLTQLRDLATQQDAHALHALLTEAKHERERLSD